MLQNMDIYKIYFSLPTKNKQYSDYYKKIIRYYLYVNKCFFKNIISRGNSSGSNNKKPWRTAVVSIMLIIAVSYGLFFYLQTITENNIKNSLIDQQRQRQIESTKAISQNIGSDLDSITARVQMLAGSVNV
jgi:hypothetical protein